MSETTEATTTETPADEAPQAAGLFGTAQARVLETQKTAGRYLHDLVEKGRVARDQQRKRLEGLYEGIRRPDLLEKVIGLLHSGELRERLRNPELGRRFAELRGEVLDLFGLATREELEALRAELAKLRGDDTSAEPVEARDEPAAAEKAETVEEPQVEASEEPVEKAKPKRKRTTRKKAAAKTEEPAAEPTEASEGDDAAAAPAEASE